MGYEGEIDVVVLIKAAPEMGRKHGETVCVAGIDRLGNWHRLYPVPFRSLTKDQRFVRWDIIRVRWRRPPQDPRVESKRIDHQTLQIVGRVRPDEIPGLVQRATVDDFELEEREGRSLALIRPSRVRFVIKRLSDGELAKSQRRRDSLLAQGDLLGSQSVLSQVAPPFAFRFEFEHAGRLRNHLCIDWETEATFFKWRRKYGEDQALKHMREMWGERITQKGVVFAMGTHRVQHWRRWLLSGVIQAAEESVWGSVYG